MMARKVLRWSKPWMLTSIRPPCNSKTLLVNFRPMTKPQAARSDYDLGCVGLGRSAGSLNATLQVASALPDAFTRCAVGRPYLFVPIVRKLRGRIRAALKKQD